MTGLNHSADRSNSETESGGDAVQLRVTPRGRPPELLGRRRNVPPPLPSKEGTTYYMIYCLKDVDCRPKKSEWLQLR